MSARSRQQRVSPGISEEEEEETPERRVVGQRRKFEHPAVIEARRRAQREQAAKAALARLGAEPMAACGEGFFALLRARIEPESALSALEDRALFLHNRSLLLDYEMTYFINTYLAEQRARLVAFADYVESSDQERRAELSNFLRKEGTPVQWLQALQRIDADPWRGAFYWLDAVLEFNALSQQIEADARATLAFWTDPSANPDVLQYKQGLCGYHTDEQSCQRDAPCAWNRGWITSACEFPASAAAQLGKF